MQAGAGPLTEESSSGSCVFLSPPRSTQPVSFCPRQDHPRGDGVYAQGALSNTEIAIYGVFTVPSSGFSGNMHENYSCIIKKIERITKISLQAFFSRAC